MLRIFISGTYEDIKDYRLAVVEQLGRMEVQGISMERFGAIDSEPTKASIETLETCNIYIGIIGHRYGTVPSGGKLSITHLEYEKANELFKKGQMRLLIYLADESIPVPNQFIQEDALRVAQQGFRRLLKSRHVPRSFKSPEDLASWVRSDLFFLAKAGDDEATEQIKIFNASDEDIYLIRGEFDKAVKENLEKVRSFLRFIAAEKFGPLFNLGDELEIHPFFGDLGKRLAEDVIPGVSLDDKEGELIRGDVRHVILRTETFITLMKKLDDKKLYEAGQQIGNTAAQDLIKGTVKGRGFVPASVEAFVKLWGFWDRTGGWGIIEPMESPAGSEYEAYQKTSHNPEWKIKVRNNFLRRKNDSLEETHRLSNFWCGYIHGMLDTALEQISEIMSDLKEEQREKVTLPAYHRVVSVTHLDDDKYESDTFSITFKKELLSDARRFLSMSRSRLNEENYSLSMALIQNALTSVRTVLGDKFNLSVSKLQLPEGHDSVIEEILSGKFPSDPNKERSNKWFSVANRLVQELSQERK